MFLALIAALTHEGPKTGNEGIAALILPIFAAMPIVFHFIFNRNAKQHLGDILAFLEREAQAT